MVLAPTTTVKKQKGMFEKDESIQTKKEWRQVEHMLMFMWKTTQERTTSTSKEFNVATSQKYRGEHLRSCKKYALFQADGQFREFWNNVEHENREANLHVTRTLIQNPEVQAVIYEVIKG